MKTRIRSVKPEVHLDEELWDLEEETRLPLFRAFVGLWSCSDREGRFEWKPRQIKSLVLPYWDGDISRVLDALLTRHFIGRYACGSREFGVVRTFKRHQKINGREAQSEIPPPPQKLFDSSNIPSRPSHDSDVSGTCDPHDDDVTRARTCGTEQNRTEQNRLEPTSPTRREPQKDNPEMSLEEFKKTMPNPDTSFLEDPPREGLWFEKPFAEMYLKATGALWDLGGRYDDAFRKLERYCKKQATVDKVPPEQVRTVVITNFFADPYARKVRFVPSQIEQNPGGYYKPPEGAAPPPDDKPHYERELKGEKEKLEYLEAHGEAEEATRSKDRIIRLTEMLKTM